jgi:hypothetical protein
VWVRLEYRRKPGITSKLTPTGQLPIMQDDALTQQNSIVPAALTQRPFSATTRGKAL